MTFAAKEAIAERDALNTRVAKLEADNARLVAENERLRLALQKIGDDDAGRLERHQMWVVAREALTPKPETKQCECKGCRGEEYSKPRQEVEGPGR